MSCWYCGSKLIWMSDANYEDVYGEGKGIVSFLKCSNDECKADVEYSQRIDDED